MPIHNASLPQNRRILIIDDNEAIHADFQKILVGDGGESKSLENSRLALFGDEKRKPEQLPFEIDSAFQGQQGLEMVQKSQDEGRPYAMAFVDVRMPPGWDGIETLQHIWKVDPELQSVLCTAYSDYSLEEMIDQLGHSDRWMVLKKPFDNIEVHQLATALTRKWELSQQAQINLEELEQRIQERTVALELANRDLAQLNKVAEASNIAKSEFLANMSHEIRTPMTAILGFADILSENITDSVNSDAVETIRRNGEFLLEIINDILDLSKIEAGKLEVESVRCVPRHILVDVCTLMEVRAREACLPLKLEFDSSIPEFIESDPTRIRQILINLISNAIKFTSEGGVRVVVRLIEPDSVSPKLQFDVVDTGIGISQERVERLFEPFNQADTSTSRRFGGTGLGLTISRRLTHMLGGDLTATSSAGEGSTFTATIATGSLEGVRLLKNENNELETPAPAPIPSENQHSTHNLACNVLLAEDGIDNQRLILHLLNKAGADVVVVGNGRKAVELALASRDEGTPFDVILMDMQMPEMDGYEATRTLRENAYQGSVVALTAHAMSGDRKKCLEAGCDGYITKPIDRKTLIETVASFSSRSENTTSNSQ